MRKLIHAIASLLFVAPPATAADRTVEIGTDVAGFLIFHPDDLAHRAADPIAWYAYSFAYRKESAAGRLVGFGTGSDGGFLIRLTMGQPTATEVKFAGAHWSYPLIVEHGQVYLDNTDGLPGEEKMDDPADFPDRWFSLPNGSYRVDVRAIARSRPGAPKNLPDYVVSFSPVADIAGIAIAENLPDLRQAPDWQAKPVGSQDAGFGLWQSAEPGTRSLPGLAATGDDVVPGQTYRLQTTEADYESYREAMGAFRVLTFTHQPVGVLARINGASFMPKRGGWIEFSPETPVMVKATSADGQVAFDLIARPDMQADTAEVETFRASVVKAIRTAQEKPSAFEEERFAALDEPEAVTSWALMHLSLPASMKIDIYRHGARERIRLITEAIENPR